MDGGETSRKGGKRTKQQEKVARLAAMAAAKQEMNEPLRISDGSSNSPLTTPHVEADVQEDQATSNPEKKKIPPRGKAKLLEIGKKRKRHQGPIPVEFNGRGQPIGVNAANFSSFIGTSARELIPLTAVTWKDVAPDFKDQLLKHITASFIVDEFYKKHVFQKMVKIWRDYRSIMIQKVEKQGKVVGLQRAAMLMKPSNVESMDEWLTLVKNRTSVEFKEKCEKFKRMRAKRILLHRTSRKSFARVEDELKKQSEKPESVLRADVWIHSYEAKPKKGSDEEVQDPEIVKQVKLHRAEQDPTQPCSIKDDAVAKVLGPDPRGRVRGLGFGAVPSKVDHQTHVGNRVAELENALNTQAQAMLSQSQEIAQLREMVNAILAQSQGNNHGTIGVQNYANKFVQQKEKGNPSATQSKQKSVQSSANGSLKTKQSNQKNTSSLHHSAEHGSQSKEKEGTGARGTEIDQNRIGLVSWFEMSEDIVAIAKLESKDPNAKVHHVPLGNECWKVWVLDVFDDIALYRPTQEFGTLSAATGSTIA